MLIEATLVGLNMNEDKTKYMQIKRKEIKEKTHVKIDNFTFENVENFNYLGYILNADNKMNIEIAERIAKGNKTYYLDDWLTVQHRSITLVVLQLGAQNSYLFTYNTFIKLLYMFRALPCSSSGGLRRNCIYAASGIVTVCR